MWRHKWKVKKWRLNLDRSMQNCVLANKEKCSTLCEGNLVNAYFNFKRSIWLTPSLVMKIPFFWNNNPLKASGRICSSLWREMTKWFGNMYPLDGCFLHRGSLVFNYDYSGEYTFSLLSHPPLDCIVICFVCVYWIDNGNYGVVLWRKKIPSSTCQCQCPRWWRSTCEMYIKYLTFDLHIIHSITFDNIPS